MTRLPENARSECVDPRVRPFGGVVESMRMFHAACAASQRPAFRPTRGSGVGVVADTIGVTGAGITAGGGGGGGGGGLPRPAGAGGGIVSGGAAGRAGAGCGAGGGRAGGGAAAGAAAGGGVVGAGAAGGAAAGVVAGGDDLGPELAHAGTPNAPAANSAAASRPLIRNHRMFLIGGFPASRSSL